MRSFTALALVSVLALVCCSLCNGKAINATEAITPVRSIITFDIQYDERSSVMSSNQDYICDHDGESNCQVLPSQYVCPQGTYGDQQCWKVVKGSYNSYMGGGCGMSGKDPGKECWALQPSRLCLQCPHDGLYERYGLFRYVRLHRRLCVVCELLCRLQ